MMKHLFLLIFVVVTVGQGFSQKSTDRVYNAKGIKEIYILTDEVFKINIATTSKKEVKIHTVSEGEYYNNISLNVKQMPERMEITSNFPKILQGGYDKLSAHKVFSLELFIEVPEGIDIYVESNIASVVGEGKYRELLVELKSGFCSLFNFTGNALINTYNGAINIEASNMQVEANSRHGKVEIPPSSKGKYHLKLTSINGDIKVRENK